MPAANTVPQTSHRFNFSVKFSSEDYCIRQTSDVLAFYPWRRLWIRRNVPYLPPFNRYTSRLPFPDARSAARGFVPRSTDGLGYMAALPAYVGEHYQSSRVGVELVRAGKSKVLAASPERAARLKGLSTSHISSLPDDYLPAYFTAQGGLLRVQRANKWRREDGKVGGGLRGKIIHFSSPSRRRLMRLIATTKGADFPDFSTLTYPAEWSSDPAVWKNDMNKLGLRVLRLCPGAAFVWKLEPQKRGAPHFHLMAWGIDEKLVRGWLAENWQGLFTLYEAFMPVWMRRAIIGAERGAPVSRYVIIRAWLAVIWFQVVGSGDENHLRAGTEYDRVRTWGGVCSYTSKYLGKVEDLPEDWRDGVGRFWGVIGRDNFPAASPEEVEIPEAVASAMIRYAKRHVGLRGCFGYGLTFLGDAAQWLRLLESEIEARACAGYDYRKELKSDRLRLGVSW